MKAIRRLLPFGLLAGVAAVPAAACGGVAGEPDATAKDAGSDTATRALADAAEDRAPAERDAAYVLSRCSGATYTAAPSGAACKPERIERSGGFAPGCYGPAVGAFCDGDRLQVSVPTKDVAALPSGFACGSAELGVSTCVWSFGSDASPHPLDEAALEAACAVTIALPTVTVRCATHGS